MESQTLFPVDEVLACRDKRGTSAGFGRHSRASEVPCDDCLDAERKRAARGCVMMLDEAQVGVACGDKIGSRTGYYRHRRAREKPCEDCRLAKNAYARAKRKPVGSVPTSLATCGDARGSYNGAARHRGAGEKPCELCALAEQTYQRQRDYRSRGAWPRPKVLFIRGYACLEQHGTPLGARRHAAANEKPCYQCLEAERARSRKRACEKRKDPAYVEAENERRREAMKDPAYREAVNARARARRRDPVKRERERELERSRSKTPTYRKRKREYERDRYRNDPTYREKALERERARCEDPAYREKRYENDRAYRQSPVGRAKKIANNLAYRGRLRALPSEDFLSPAAMAGMSCACCGWGEENDDDHIVSLTAGVTDDCDEATLCPGNVWWNIQVLCGNKKTGSKACNQSKGAGTRCYKCDTELAPDWNDDRVDLCDMWVAVAMRSVGNRLAARS